MKSISSLSIDELQAFYNEAKQQYDAYRQKGVSINMARGKPSPQQLDLSNNLLDLKREDIGIKDADGNDVRNYGGLCGIPECRALFGEMMGVPADNVIAAGSSSLNLMHDLVAHAYALGVCGNEPWCRQGTVKFLCPSPGYDRHFGVTAHYGIENIPVPMTPDGPDMDMVERLVQTDPQVKGIWCVPKYSNPQGYTYSDETVRAFAALRPAADDFRIFWDNAYMVHGFREKDDHLLNIFDACKEFGSEDMVYEFMSTSKVTFSGAGVAVFAASQNNVDFLLKQMGVQTIGYDKINQLRHVHYLKSVEGVKAHMQKQADYLRPKFDFTLTMLENGLGQYEIGTWTKPNGGYFISYDGLPGTARRCVQLCADAGVKLTGAGAAFPYHKDPLDNNIRIAPSFPSIVDLRTSMEVFSLCQRIAAAEALLAR